MIENEAATFSGERPGGTFLILDDPEWLERGRFPQPAVNGRLPFVRLTA